MKALFQAYYLRGAYSKRVRLTYSQGVPGARCVTPDVEGVTETDACDSGTGATLREVRAWVASGVPEVRLVTQSVRIPEGLPVDLEEGLSAPAGAHHRGETRPKQGALGAEAALAAAPRGTASRHRVPPGALTLESWCTPWIIQDAGSTWLLGGVGAGTVPAARTWGEASDRILQAYGRANVSVLRTHVRRALEGARVLKGPDGEPVTPGRAFTVTLTKQKRAELRKEVAKQRRLLASAKAERIHTVTGDAAPYATTLWWAARQHGKAVRRREAQRIGRGMRVTVVVRNIGPEGTVHEWLRELVGRRVVQGASVRDFRSGSAG